MCFSLGLPCMGLSVLLGLHWLLPFLCGGFNYNFFQNFLSAFFFPSSGTPITRMLICLILSQRSLRLSSVFSFLSLYSALQQLFLPFSSPAHVSLSLSVALLLAPSRAFLISVIVLFISVCLIFFLVFGDCINYGKCSSHFLHFILF